MTSVVDVVVIGMGPGGEEVAGRLAEAGLEVTGIERDLVGGECPYWGCVPSKMAIRAAGTLAEARRVPGLAGAATVQPDWGPVAERIRSEATDDWDDTVAVQRFESTGGRFVRGTGRLVASDAVEVDGRVLRARRGIVIATGARAAVPPIPGLVEAGFWTNRDFFEAKELPESLLVLGGGAIGVELTQAAARFGVDVTVIEALERLLPPEEPESGKLLGDVLEDEGITVRTGIAAQRVERNGDGNVIVHLDTDRVAGEEILVATGRRVDLSGLGLDTVGLDPLERSLDVDGHMRAGPGIWAVGDVTGIGMFTHVAVYQARIAAADILGDNADATEADYRALPRVTFTDPEIGSVGLTERAARDAGIPVMTASTQVSHSARGWIHRAGNAGFVKLIVDRSTATLVGATSAGPAGGEVLGFLALAVHARIPVPELRRMIFAYPTFHRAIEDALAQLPLGA